jgi:hypothetical protein
MFDTSKVQPGTRRSLNYIYCHRIPLTSPQRAVGSSQPSLIHNLLFERGATIMPYQQPTISTESDTSEDTSEDTPGIAPGHIRLVLVHPEFYLDIPLNIITPLCLRPRKYLVFLGWCILGVDGDLAESDSSSEHIELDGDLNEGESYYYVTRERTGKWSLCVVVLSTYEADNCSDQ